MRKARKSLAKRIKLLVALLAGLPLAACGSGKDALTVVTIGSPASPFEKTARLSPPARLIRAATVEGLVGFDEQGQIVPALADRWIVTDDGLSYIFRLRDGTWADGSPLTAQSLRTALRETMAGLRGMPLALDLSGITEIRVMTGRVIEIRLAAPMPNLLQLLAQPELGLAHEDLGTGPMRLRRDGDVALLTAIPPEGRGLPQVEGWSGKVRPLRLLALPAEQAVARFNSGEADVLLGGRIEDFPLAGSVGLIRGTIQLDPVMGLFGLAVSETDGFLAAPENREAVAMAIDRSALIDAFGVGGWTPTTRIVGAGVADDPGSIGERWPGLSIGERRAQATARVNRWRATQPGAPAPVELRLALPRGRGGDILFARLRADLAAVGIEAQQVGPDDEAELRLVDAVARYPRAAWFLNQLGCGARRGLCSEDADRLVAQAQRASDPAVGKNLLADAEAELTKANAFIPFGPPIRWSLVRGDVHGFAANRWNIHPLMPMAMLPK
ncbi:ABC transporter substrate-binding protein [Novosphingobium sp. G106]|uniref:ABC transporter substrate-binding protein n=1 Tax=Novosphingobium sp. G106 TaxID=2849500 RepID=UPI001C2D77A7|nr:ABC transporter substrate-binding protein [Novosphingobium sp. G106]MBV1689894.1 ABC transporter substrate-binding protein [Novosphingobium sp. G106]